MELVSLNAVKKMAKTNLTDKVGKDAVTSDNADTNVISKDDLQSTNKLNSTLSNLPIILDTPCSGSQLYKMVMDIMSGVDSLRRFHYRKLYNDHGNNRVTAEKWGKAYFKKTLPASPKKFARNLAANASASLPVPSIENPFTEGKLIVKDDIDKFFIELESLWQKQYNNNTIEYTESTCHSNCHSNCHGNCHSSCHSSCHRSCHCNCNCNWIRVDHVDGHSDYRGGSWNVTARGHQYNVSQNSGSTWRQTGGGFEINTGNAGTKNRHK